MGCMGRASVGAWAACEGQAWAHGLHVRSEPLRMGCMRGASVGACAACAERAFAHGLHARGECGRMGCMRRASLGAWVACKERAFCAWAACEGGKGAATAAAAHGADKAADKSLCAGNARWCVNSMLWGCALVCELNAVGLCAGV
eukprot:363526-Chlamydomonas_euryale.AAC.8